MNLKACCGLLANKDDEDHDYEDVAQEPLPKPQTAAEARKVCDTNIDTIYTTYLYCTYTVRSGHEM